MLFEDGRINLSSESPPCIFLIMLMFMHTYNELLTISMSSTMSSTLNLNLRMTEIGIRCSGTKKCSQMYEIDNFCLGIVFRY